MSVISKTERPMNDYRLIYVLTQSVRRAETTDTEIIWSSSDKKYLEDMIDDVCATAGEIHGNEGFADYVRQTFTIVEVPYSAVT